MANNIQFVEYNGDDEIFEKQIFQLAQCALEYAENLMRFKSIKYANRCMSKLIFQKRLKELLRKWNGPIFDYYNAAMIKFLNGELKEGVRLIQKLHNFNLDGSLGNWAAYCYSEFCQNDITIESAREKVCLMVNVRQKYFKQKAAFKKMPELIFS